ncbi:glutaminase GtaA [Xylariaceae sp. FL0804]|nr:glutaminase GtaA [Xylariaceae sp. FL0804]
MGLKAALTGAVLFGGLALAQSTFSPARPPSIPLAVKAPYLETWQDAGSDGGNGGYLYGEWPVFWTQRTTGWTGLIRVDGTSYVWMGDPSGVSNTVNQTSFTYTSTRSTFVMNVADKVQMTITFLSPVTPTDLRRQSLVFSYLDVAVSSLDGAGHRVQLYSDCTAEWASGDDTSIVTWNHSMADGVSYHKFALENQTEITETNNQANWGDWWYSTSAGRGLTWQNGEDTVVRGNFLSNGSLANKQDSNYRAVDDDWPVFAFAHDLGYVRNQTISKLFTIGLTQYNAIELLGAGSNLTTYQSLWTSYFSSDVDAMTFFYNDWSQATALATTLDNQVASDSMAAGGLNYTIITTLSVRQAFGALQFTGTPDDPVVFLKEISSDGDIQTVDVIYPTMPIILYTNAELLKYMLNPLFLNQENGHYPETSAIHDLGTFPLASGYPDGGDEPQPLEECGNMIIMTLAYAQKYDDNDYLSQHYTLLNQWAGYLVNESLIPANQISTDDFAGSLANQTNLAIKGIIGLRAMAEISERVGDAANASYYLNVSTSYIAQWEGFALNNASDPPHTTLSYGNESSYSLLYNLYANSLLGFGAAFVPQYVYDVQSAFYPTVADQYGVPLDTRHTYTKSDWENLCAAIASESTRDMFLGKIANWIDVTPSNEALTDLYDCVTGDFPAGGPDFTARPVVGGHFALLALPANATKAT